MASPTLGTYCNTTVPPKVRSMANTMWVKFYSDSSVSKPGFQATYSTGSGLEYLSDRKYPRHYGLSVCEGERFMRARLCVCVIEGGGEDTL